MRRAVEFLATRVLRSRLGVALGIAMVVLGIIGAARLFSGPADPGSGLGNPPSRPITTVDPTTGDDGLIATGPPPSPSIRPGAASPETMAQRFTTAWLGRTGMTPDQWRAALRPLSTATLNEELAEADPSTVPAQRAVGEAELVPRTASFVEVTIPLDNGRLRLELVGPDGSWLVDAVDWEQP
ncbi:hypothetical protein [Micromonospora echinofusca]|uniref:DUF4878 domain-containing protein n=1 Tax=Micromonospora echinofusca TaxID=47858 RepID=A0ABS3VKH0_MICEH|nr:hypothetical protein [Micromonospora echinofusca]MBO4204981.1 hypothetical protein [Micromonospora echinofusca]